MHSVEVARGGDFYEDDEPLDELLAEFEAGEKGVTGPPPELGSRTVFFDLGTGHGRDTDLVPSGRTDRAPSH